MSPVSAADVVGARFLRRRRIEGIGAREHGQRNRRVVGGARHRPNLIERGRKRDQPVARDAAVGRLQADDAAERGRLPDRAAGIGAERNGREAGGDGDSRAAAGSAGDVIRVPRIARGSERRVFGRRSHRKLVAVGLAHHDGARRLEPSDDGGVVRRNERAEHLRRGGGRDAARHDVVFERDRHSRKRARVLVAIDRARPLERALGGDGEKRVQRRVVRVDARERLLADFDGRNLPCADGVPNLARGLKGKLVI